MADAMQRAWVARVLGVGGGDSPTEFGEGAPRDGQPSRKDGPLVTYRKSLLFFESARKGVQAELKTFAGLIAKRLPEEAKLADAVAADIDEFCGQLRDSIDDGINGLSESKPELNARTRNEILDLMDSVAANPLIAHVDSNPIMPMSVATTLITALGRVAGSIV